MYTVGAAFACDLKIGGSVRLFNNQRYGVWGFTGTRNQPTLYQTRMFTEMLYDAMPGVDEFHHGNCVGADEAAHQIVWIARDNIKIVVHPPLVTTYESKHLSDYTLANMAILERKDYMDRNHDIVDACNRLIAMPGEMFERKRSGTWATVRYARKQRKPITILWPNGSWKDE